MKKSIIFFKLKALGLICFALFYFYAPSLNAQTWISTYTSGVKQAEESKKPLLILMSYEVDSKIKATPLFNSKEFKALAKENFICAKIDMRWNYKSDTYEPRSNINEKAIPVLGISGCSLFLLDPKSGKKETLASYSSTLSALTFDKFSKDFESFKSKMAK